MVLHLICFPIKFKEIFEEFDIKRVSYVNNPGSFMSIKLFIYS